MNLYVLALVTHVLVAILGLGSVVCVAIMAATVRRSGRGAAEAVDVDPAVAAARRRSAWRVC